MESCLDIMIFSSINVHNLDWSDMFWSVIFSNVIAIVYMVILVLGIITLFVLYPRNRNLLDKEDGGFKGRYDAVIDGLNLTLVDTNFFSFLFYAFMFFIRRIAMAMCLVFMNDFIFGYLVIF